MSNPPITGFDALEQQFGAVALALRNGDSAQLEALSSQLQQMTLDFARAVQEAPPQRDMSTTQLRRIRALGQGFQVLRDSLARRQALVDQALRVVVPAVQTATYGAASASPYGAGPKASGKLHGIQA